MHTDLEMYSTEFGNSGEDLINESTKESYIKWHRDKPHIRRKRRAEVTELPGHRGRLKIVEGVQWHDDLLDMNSDAFLQLEEDIIIMVRIYFAFLLLLNLLIMSNKYDTNIRGWAT